MLGLRALSFSHIIYRFGSYVVWVSQNIRMLNNNETDSCVLLCELDMFLFCCFDFCGPSSIVDFSAPLNTEIKSIYLKTRLTGLKKDVTSVP